MKLKKTMWLSLAAALLLSGTGWSITAYQGPVQDMYQGDRVAFRAGAWVGQLDGESRELSFAPELFNQIISELTWDIDSVVYLGGILSFQFFDRFQVNYGFWDEQSHKTGRVRDSDWLLFLVDLTPGQEGVLEKYKLLFSDHKAPLTEAKGSDINAAYSFLKLDGNQLSSMIPIFTPDQSSLVADFVVGHQSTKWGWKAVGGHYNYFGEQGTFGADEVLGTYRQDIDIPYLGFGVNLMDKKHSFTSHMFFSRWADVDAFDQHLLRDITFTETIKDAKWSGFGFDYSWYFTDHWTATLSWERENLKKAQGNMVVRDVLTGETYFFSDAAGASHKNSSYGLTLSFRT